MKKGLFLGAVLLAGCANLKPDYVAPTSGPMATVEVADVAGTINRRVLVHGADVCSAEQAKLVGIVKSKAVGIDYVETQVIRVEANKPIAISMPWANPRITGVAPVPAGVAFAVTTKYCQPVAVFTPTEGRRYRLDFAECTARITDDRGVSNQAETDPGCELGDANHDPRQFFLRPKKQGAQ